MTASEARPFQGAEPREPGQKLWAYKHFGTPAISSTLVYLLTVVSAICVVDCPYTRFLLLVCFDPCLFLALFNLFLLFFFLCFCCFLFFFALFTVSSVVFFRLFLLASHGDVPCNIKQVSFMLLKPLYIPHSSLPCRSHYSQAGGGNCIAAQHILWDLTNAPIWCQS